MRAHSSSRRPRSAPWILLAPALLLAIAGCAEVPAPPEGLPSAAQMARTAYGGYVRLLFHPGGDAAADLELRGELIAISDERLFVLRAHRLEQVCLAHVGAMTLSKYDSRTSDMLAWTGVGALSTFTQGFWFILTMPAWLLVGSLTAAVDREQAILEYPGDTLADFARYARFPQGLPASVVDASDLEPHRRAASRPASAPASLPATARVRSAPQPRRLVLLPCEPFVPRPRPQFYGPSP